MRNENTRVDLHVHSSASQLSKLGIQRSLALPECATHPTEVYELAKRRGMDFVTLTDHDTITGALALADLPDTFISEELTAHFRGEPQAVHVLCYGITCEDHEWLQAHRGDVELCAGYMYEQEIVCALAHPYYTVAAPLTARHRRRLAELFDTWEIRNGARARELNRPAATYGATREAIGIGGSDDHAGIDIGRTYSETPPARTPQEFLGHVRAGHTTTAGDQGSAAKWTHAALALAIRSLRGLPAGQPDPQRVLQIVMRVLAEGEARRGPVAGDLGPADAQALLDAWLSALELHCDGPELLRLLASGEISHAALHRRARLVHERRLSCAVRGLAGALGQPRSFDLGGHALALFNACMPAIPYAASGAFLGSEKRKVSGEPDQLRVALVADGLDAMHGVSAAVRQIRERGVLGFEVEVIGTDRSVDHRLSAVAEIDAPFYPGLRLGVPGLPAVVSALAEGRYDLVHVCTPGPAGILAGLIAHTMGQALISSYHTELASYAGVRSGRAELEFLVSAGLRMFYGACECVLSPSPASDERLLELGVGHERIARWDRGVDLTRFDPRLATPGALPGAVNVLYAGRLAAEKGIDLLTDAFSRARAEDPRLHLVLAGIGPEEEAMRERLGAHATFLGWLAEEELARV